MSLPQILFLVVITSFGVNFVIVRLTFLMEISFWMNIVLSLVNRQVRIQPPLNYSAVNAGIRVEALPQTCRTLFWACSHLRGNGEWKYYPV